MDDSPFPLPDNASPANTRAKGASGESRAAQFLIDKGFAIVERNYRVPIGEIDIVARDADGTLVFVEVKSAGTNKCGHPFSWITPLKQRKLSKLARWYRSARHAKGPCRFDAVAVTADGRVEHLRNAFLV